MDNEELLKEIRDTFDRDMTYYKEIREEGDTDIRFLSGDPWDPEEKQARKDAKRPIVAEDYLNQFVNQVSNDQLISTRDVEVDQGDGGDPEVAQLTGDLLRQINYDSDGNDAHHTAFENAVCRSYGSWGILVEFEKGSFNKKIIIRRFQNPNSVIWDPDCKEADFSDMNHAFVIDRMLRRDFEKKYPNAARADSFFDESIKLAPKWFGQDDVQIAEFWKREPYERTMIGVLEGGAPNIVYLDELPVGTEVNEKKRQVTTPATAEFPKGVSVPILNFEESTELMIRKCEERRVVQYLTNGVEILKKEPWLGSWIPIFPVIGKEFFVDKGAGPTRTWLSLIRLARDAQTRLNYFRTCQVEAVGQIPKTKFMMYEGQIEGHEDQWKDAPRKPQVALLVKPIMDATGANVLPLPTVVNFVPPIVPMEAGAQSAQQAIQSAIGSFSTSVGDTDVNVKSGIAIEKLQNQTQIGSIHFRASFDRALRNQGRQEDELIPKIYTTPRDVVVRSANGETKSVRINDKNAAKPIMLGSPNRVTITVGPSYASQKERADSFVDTMIQQSPEIFALIGDIAIEMKGLPPDITRRLKERLTPPQFAEKGDQQLPPDIQKQIDDRDDMIDRLTETVKMLTEERDAKAQEGQTKVAIEEARASSAMAIEQLRMDVELLKSKQKTMVDMEKINSEENLRLMEQRNAATEERSEEKLERDRLALERERLALDKKTADTQAKLATQKAKQQAKPKAKKKETK